MLMKEYLSRFIGKKISLVRAGTVKDVYCEGTLKEICGNVAVLVTPEDEELGIPLDKILLIGPPTIEKDKTKKAGFLGD